MSLVSKIQKVEKLSPRLRNLYLHKIIRNAGLGLVGMFGPIFFYVLSGSLEFVLIYYGMVTLVYLILLPLWAKALKYASMHIFMAIASIFTIVYYLIMYFLACKEVIISTLIILLILTYAFERLFYWVPYHVELARFMDKHHRGRQFSFLNIFITLLAVVLPIFSAFVINKFGFQVLFILTMVVVLISILPLFFISHTREGYSFGYFESFKKFFSKKHIRTNLAYCADGFQNTIGVIIWPVFIFMILEGEYLSVGLITAAIILITCVLQFLMGELTDKFDRKKLMKIGSVFYSLGWIFKAIVATGWHIFLAGTYHNLTKVVMRTPFDVLMYEIAADEGHYVDEFTVLREISINLGRILMLGLAWLLIGFTNIIWVFVLGAGVSLLMNLISKEEFGVTNP